MGFLTAVAEKRHTVSYESLLSTFKEPAQWLRDWAGGQESASGVRVDKTTALWSTAYYCGVRILAESVAQLPLIVYERKAGGGRVRVDNHPLSHLLHFQPNHDMTSFDWRESGMGHVLTWGNSYSRIVRSKPGEVLELVPLHPAKIGAKRLSSGKLIYEHRSGEGKPVRFQPEDIFHVHGLGFDGVSGYSPVALHAQSIGLGMALQEYAARLFSNNATPGGVIEHPTTLSESAAKRMAESWETMHRGLANSHKVAVLEEGAVYKPMSFAPREAQSVEARIFQVQEVARILRLPPHMLADHSKSSFNNIQDENRSFVTKSLGPWLVRWEQAMLARLFLPSERARLFAEFNVEGFLRGDIKTRFEAYAVGIQNGIYSIDEVRQKENENNLEGGLGEHHFMPMNIQTVERAVAGPVAVPEPDPEVDPDPEPGPEPELEADRAGAALARGEAHIPVFRDAFERLLHREVRGVRRLLKNVKDDKLHAAVREFYDQHRGTIARTISPAVRSVVASVHPAAHLESFVVSYSEAMGRRRADSNMGLVTRMGICFIDSKMAEWESAGCGDAAQQEVKALIEHLATNGPEEVE